MKIYVVAVLAVVLPPTHATDLVEGPGFERCVTAARTGELGHDVYLRNSLRKYNELSLGRK
jgi:hypothetical protein